MQREAELPPAMRTYELVKQRFEQECFKLVSHRGKFASILKFDAFPQLCNCACLKAGFADLYYFETTIHGVIVKKAFIPRWLADPAMRTVDRIAVDPTCTRANVYNLWKPFKVLELPPVDDAIVPDLVQPMVDHIHRRFASQDADRTTWILDYLANMVQRPERRAKVAIVLVGEHDWEGDVLLRMFREEILGPFSSFRTESPLSRFFGRFGNDAIHRVLIQVDGVRMLGRLKTLVENDLLSFRRKGKELVALENVSNLIITSSNRLGIGFGDRRFAVLRYDWDVGTRFIADHVKRPEVVRAFYQHLMARDLSRYVEDFQATRPFILKQEDSKRRKTGDGWV
jgi:hypothetical protein